MLGLVFISSCESDAEVEIPFEPVKLVVSSFLDPNEDTNYVSLSKTDPVFDNNAAWGQDLIIRNAIIKISDGTNEATLRFDTDKDVYFFNKADLDIDFNKVYTITASAINQTINVSFRTIDSSSIVIKEFLLDSVTYEDGFGDIYKTYKAKIKFDDPASEVNYYRIYLRPVYGNIFGEPIDEYYFDVYDNLVLSDEGKNGSEMNITAEYEEYTYLGMGSNIKGFKLFVYKIDEDHYKYIKSLKNYTGDDPFSEPSLIYTNVPNGLGLVGSQMVKVVNKAL